MTKRLINWNCKFFYIVFSDIDVASPRLVFSVKSISWKFAFTEKLHLCPIFYYFYRLVEPHFKSKAELIRPLRSQFVNASAVALLSFLFLLNLTQVCVNYSYFVFTDYSWPLQPPRPLLISILWMEAILWWEWMQTLQLAF